MKMLYDLQRALGYQFEDIDLLRLALAHSSWANENSLPGVHNERLEFLGDAVLELCVSTQLFRRFPDCREGVLTSMRARLVGERALANFARAIGIDKYVRLGAGEEKQGGRQRDSILSDAFEAVFAAIYLDGGFIAAMTAVEKVFANAWSDEHFQQPALNAKSRLQEVSQRLFKALPEYSLLESSGPEHDKIFRVKLLLPDGIECTASASSCKKAEQACAAMALLKLESLEDGKAFKTKKPKTG